MLKNRGNRICGKIKLQKLETIEIRENKMHPLSFSDETVTGRMGACMAVGGTYVHELKNGVAFGAVGQTTDTHMHGANEFMLIS